MNPVNGKHREDRGDQELTDELPALVESEVSGVADADVVVQESQESGRDDDGDDQDAAARKNDGGPDVTHHVAEDGRHDDEHAAHRGRTGLDEMCRGQVFVDLLTE